MKKLLEQESVEALRTAVLVLGAIVYFALFGFMWGMVLFFYLATFFFALPLAWKQNSKKANHIGLIALGIWWLLPLLTLFF